MATWPNVLLDISLIDIKVSDYNCHTILCMVACLAFSQRPYRSHVAIATLANVDNKKGKNEPINSYILPSISLRPISRPYDMYPVG